MTCNTWDNQTCSHWTHIWAKLCLEKLFQQWQKRWSHTRTKPAKLIYLFQLFVNIIHAQNEGCVLKNHTHLFNCNNVFHHKNINKLAQLQLSPAWGVWTDGCSKLLIRLTMEAKSHRTQNIQEQTSHCEKFSNAEQECPTEFQTRTFGSCQSLSGWVQSHIYISWG